LALGNLPKIWQIDGLNKNPSFANENSAPNENPGAPMFSTHFFCELNENPSFPNENPGAPKFSTQLFSQNQNLSLCNPSTVISNNIRQ
jgi:hypothetical protein